MPPCPGYSCWAEFKAVFFWLLCADSVQLGCNVALTQLFAFTQKEQALHWALLEHPDSGHCVGEWHQGKGISLLSEISAAGALQGQLYSSAVTAHNGEGSVCRLNKGPIVTSWLKNLFSHRDSITENLAYKKILSTKCETRCLRQNEW